MSVVALPPAHRVALGRIVSMLPLSQVDWALTGSTSHALQGVSLAAYDAIGRRERAELLRRHVT